MKKDGTQPDPRNFDYPVMTKGSQIAAKIRSEANALTEAQRDSFFKRGMQIVCGGAGTKEAIRAGR